MTTTEFNLFAALVYQKSGIALTELKHELLRARMGKRMRALKLNSVKEYYAVIQNDESGLELERLVDVVTTNKTDFFRESKHYEHLIDEVVPAYRASASARQGQPLRIWSAACSSGEEPYSLAMALTEAFGDKLSFKILATDISSRMLRKAMAARYPADRMQGVPAGLRERYFNMSRVEGEKVYEVVPGLRETVQFSRFNLTDPRQYVFQKPFDAIFCRNVMIYFDRPTQEAVVSQLSRHLGTQGFLYTGFSESLIGIRHNLKNAAASVYRAGTAWDSLN